MSIFHFCSFLVPSQSHCGKVKHPLKQRNYGDFVSCVYTNSSSFVPLVHTCSHWCVFVSRAAPALAIQDRRETRVLLASPGPPDPQGVRLGLQSAATDRPLCAETAPSPPGSPDPEDRLDHKDLQALRVHQELMESQ